MRSEGLKAAKTWLERDNEIVQTGPDALIGRRRPDKRLKPGLDVAYEDQETAVLVVDEFTIGNGQARQRYLRALEWKRAQPGRALAIFVPRDLSPAWLVEFKDATVTVAYPLVSFGGAWG